MNDIQTGPPVTAALVFISALAVCLLFFGFLAKSAIHSSRLSSFYRAQDICLAMGNRIDVTDAGNIICIDALTNNFTILPRP